MLDLIEPLNNKRVLALPSQIDMKSGQSTYTNRGCSGEREVRKTLPMALVSIGSPVGVPVPESIINT